MSNAAKKRVAKNDNSDDEVDWYSVFPTSRIKSQIMNDEKVGRLSNKAAEYVGKTRSAHFIACMMFCFFLTLSHFFPAGACSALFLQSLVSDAKEMKNDSAIITLENVCEAAAKHSFLDGALDGVSEQSAPRRPRKKKAKLDHSVKDSAIQEAMAVCGATAAVASLRPEVTVDDEEYD